MAITLGENGINSGDGNTFQEANISLGAPEGFSPEKSLLEPSQHREQRERDVLRDYRRESRNSIDNAVLGFDKFSEGDSDEVKRRKIIRGVLQTEFDITPSNTWGYRAARASAARKLFDGEGGDSDESFFAKLAERATRRKDKRDFYSNLDTDAVNSYIRGNETQKDFFDRYKDNDQYKKEGSLAVLRWREMQDALNDQYGDVAPLVQNVYRRMEAGAEWATRAAALAKTLPDDRKDVFLQLLRQVALDNPSPEVEGSIRRITNNFAKGLDRGVVGAFKDMATGLSDVQKRMGSSYRGLGGFAGSLDAGKEAAHEKGLDEAWQKAHREEADFIAEVRGIFENEYDPIRPLAEEGSKMRAIEEGVYAMPGAIATSVQAAIPVVGTTMVFGTLMEGARQGYRDQMITHARAQLAAEGKDTYLTGEQRDRIADTAGALSLVSAAPQMVLEKIQAGAIMGKIPGLENIFKAIDGRVANRLARGTAKFTTGAIYETGIELSQDMVNDLVMDFAHEFSEIAPDVEWSNGVDGHFDGYFNKSITTFVAVAPLAIMGAVGGLSAEKRADAFRVLPKQVKQAYGMREEDIDALDNAETPAERVEALATAEANRDPNSEEAKAANEQAEAEAKHAQESMEEAQRAGILPGIRVKGDGETATFEIYDTETGESKYEVATAQEATEAIFFELGAKESEHETQFEAIRSKLLATELASDGTVIEVEDVKEMTIEEAGRLFENADARLQEESRLLERTRGGSGEISEVVFGAALPSGVGGRQDATMKLYRGSSVFTVVHEKAHQVRRELMARGEFTTEEQINFFRKLNEVLKEGEKFAGFDTDEVSETAMDEAWAQLAEVSLLQTHHGERSKMRQLLDKNLKALVQSADKTATKFSSFIAAMKKFFGLNLSRAAQIKKAVRDGKLDTAELEKFQAAVLGQSPQAEYETQVEQEAAKIEEAASVPVESTPFSIAPLNREQIDSILPGAEYLDPEEAKWATIDGPVIIGAYHGSTHDIDRFEAGQKIGDFGNGIYASTSWEDVSNNYAGEGPDLTARITNDTGELADKIESQFEEKGREVVLESLSRSYNGELTFISDDISKMDDYDAAHHAAELIVRQKLVGEGGGRIYPLYVPMKNPVVIGETDNEIYVDLYGISEEELQDYLEYAEENYREENGLDEDAELDEDARDEIRQIALDDAQDSGVESKLMEAISQAAWEYSFDASAILENIGREVSLNQLNDIIREANIDPVGEDGPVSSGQVVREIFEALGYDGIIDRTVSRFGMEGIDENTVHIITSADGANRPRSAIDPEVSFSLGDAQIAGALGVDVVRRIEKPAMKAEILGNVARTLDKARMAARKAANAIEQDEGVVADPTKVSELKKQAELMRQRREDELIQEIMNNEGRALSAGEALKIKDMPLHSYIAKPGKGVRGGIMESKSAFIKRTGQKPGGEYDGSETATKQLVFGGTRSPDQVARELYSQGLLSEDSVGEMWEKLAQERDSAKQHQQDFKHASKLIRDAKQKAKDESREWLDKQLDFQSKNFDPMTRMRDALALLDSIIKVLPIDLRGRIGGYVQISKLNTEEARLKFLHTRIEKMEKVVDRYVKAGLEKELKKLKKRVKQQRKEAGKSDRGKYDAPLQNIFNAAMAAIDKDETAVATVVAGLSAEIDKRQTEGTLTPELEAELDTTIMLVEQFGDWKNRTLQEREVAIKNAWDVFEIGYARVLNDRKQEKARIEGVTSDLLSDTKVTGSALERDLRSQDEQKKGWKYWGIGFMDFGQLLGSVFGIDSKQASRYEEWERQADYTKKDRMFRHQTAIESFFTALTGDPVKGLKLQHKMQTETYTVEIPATASRKASTRQITLGQMIQARMMWRQPDGRRHMEGHDAVFDKDGNEIKPATEWAYTQEFMDNIDKLMTGDAKSLENFLTNEYQLEYDTLNEVHQRMYGTSMPKNDLYSPLTMSPLQKKGSDLVDPLTGQTVSETQMQPSSVVRRSTSAVAEPRFLDALHTYYGHKAQIEHWMAYAELSKEINKVFGNRKMRNAIESKGGVEALNALTQWQKLFAQGGIKDSAMTIASMQGLQRGMGRLAQAALVGRMSVLAIQSTQLGAALAHMSTGRYLKGIGKLLTGQISWKDAISSDFIQRRVKDAPPAVRMAMEQLRSSKPSKAKYIAHKMGNLISGADAFFTGATYAIILDHQKELGLSDSAAHAKAAKLTEQVAQPVRSGKRSLFENTAKNPFFTLSWAFASESRQKVMLAGYSMFKGRTKAEKARAVAVAWGFGGAMASVIRAIMGDIRDDEDEEYFDEKYWNPARLAAQTLAGPVGGFPIIGDMAEAGTWWAAKQLGFDPGWLPDGNLLDIVPKALKSGGRVLENVLTDEEYEDFDTVLKDIDTIVNGSALFSDTGAAYSSFVHLVRDLYKLGANIVN